MWWPSARTMTSRRGLKSFDAIFDKDAAPLVLGTERGSVTCSGCAGPRACESGDADWKGKRAAAHRAALRDTDVARRTREMGSIRVPRVCPGVAPGRSWDKLVWATGFRRDAENGNRDGRAPRSRRSAGL
jgi:hypothetical protein